MIISVDWLPASLQRGEFAGRPGLRSHKEQDQRDAFAVDEQDVKVDENFNQDECRIENPVRIEQQRNRNSQRRKAVAQCPIDECGEACDRDQDNGA